MNDDVRITTTQAGQVADVTLVIQTPSGPRYCTPVFPHRGEFRAVLDPETGEPVVICPAHGTSGNPPPCPVHPDSETI
jgi:hypothetical protein